MPDRLRTAARVSGRVLTGLIAAGVSAVVILVLILVPLPTVGDAPAGVSVTPVPGEEWRVCAGAALRFGTADGAEADTAFALGAVTVGRGSAAGTDPQTERLDDPGADVDLVSQGPLLLRGAAGSAPVGAQSQLLSEDGLTGLATASCVEPGGSAWLVGGATTVGRTTLLELVNPSEVDATVSLRIWGEDGLVSAAGLTGISVPASARRVISLAAFAPGLASPVIEVSTRGGRIAAFLQQSVVRGLDAGGTALVTPSADPAPTVTIPGVRILSSTSVAAAMSGAGWEDAEPVLRLLAPEDAAEATVVLTPAAGQEGESSSYVVELAAGEVMEFPITAGVLAELNSTLPDGVYSVTVSSDVDVIAGVRATTAGAAPLPGSAPASDFAWFSSAPVLSASAGIQVAAGPNPLLAIANPGETDATVSVRGIPDPVSVPAGGVAVVPVAAGLVLLDGVEGLSVQLSYAGAALLGATSLVPPRPLADPVLIRL